MNKYSADELFKIAYDHLQKRNYGKSAGLFEKLLKDYPRNLSILKNLSHCYVFIKEFESQSSPFFSIIKEPRIDPVLILKDLTSDPVNTSPASILFDIVKL